MTSYLLRFTYYLSLILTIYYLMHFFLTSSAQNIGFCCLTFFSMSDCLHQRRSSAAGACHRGALWSPTVLLHVLLLFASLLTWTTCVLDYNHNVLVEESM